MSEKKYDLQIIVPVIPQRLEGFQKFGLFNVGRKKVLVHCLIGKNEEEIYKDGWPDGVDVRILPNKTDNPVAQIYGFLSRFDLEDASAADWFAKIDDDTYNDISNLVDHLANNYSFDKEYYVVPEIRSDMESNEIRILKELDLWDKIDNNFCHELECCVFSKKTICSIVQNDDCMELFSARKKCEAGHTDQCLGAAAKLCGIHPNKDRRFSIDRNKFIDCSLFGGDLFHFHPICADKNKIHWNIINKLF